MEACYPSRGEWENAPTLRLHLRRAGATLLPPTRVGGALPSAFPFHGRAVRPTNDS